MTCGDFRIYLYTGYAILKKPLHRTDHKFKSLEEAEEKADYLSSLMRSQVVIIEYFNKNSSRIIKTINFTE